MKKILFCFFLLSITGCKTGKTDYSLVIRIRSNPLLSKVKVLKIDRSDHKIISNDRMIVISHVGVYKNDKIEIPFRLNSKSNVDIGLGLYLNKEYKSNEKPVMLDSISVESNSEKDHGVVIVTISDGIIKDCIIN